ncbi:MAG TPA: transglycosylase domain-containing protein [Catenuloplanes sp.]|jgi:membrane peptidoglycan carboxypeptidase
MPVRFAPVKVLSLLLCGLLAGLVVAGFALPATALAGLTARYATESWEDLPSELRTPPSDQTTNVYANDGRTLITAFYEENRTDVAAQEIPEVMRQAIIAAEDTRFYQHHGVDVQGALRAAVANVRGAEQGASTLTMQYVRNVLKTDDNRTAEEREDATRRTAGRKIQEARYAVTIEKKLPKLEILRRYLNIAYFGDGAYGIYAASRNYFGKAPNKLTLAEAALLAGLVKSPDAFNPATGDREEALGRRTYVLGAMVRTGAITRQQADAADREELKLQPRKQPNNCTAVAPKHNDWGFFCDFFVQWWKEQASFGRTPQERERNLKRGGYRVVTTLDPRVQAAAVKQSLQVYSQKSPRALPIAAVQPGTGHVLAMAVNRKYSLDKNPNGQRTYPNTVNQLIAGSTRAPGYQAGSTFKMFTMLAALDAGLPLTTTLTTKSPHRSGFPASGPNTCGGYYCPSNADPKSMDGARNMWTGFGRSANTFFVALEEQVGVPKVVAMAQKLGIQFRAESNAREVRTNPHFGAFTLGVTSTTPLDLANAYATVAADGKYCAPLPVLSITDSTGAKVAAGQPQCRQVVGAEAARAAIDAARCPVGQQSAFGKCDGATAGYVSGLLQGRPVAGKTGSSENYSTESFVGVTPQLAAAGIAANPENPNDSVGAAVSRDVNAAVAAVLVAGLRDQPHRDFKAPSRTIAFGGG